MRGSIGPRSSRFTPVELDAGRPPFFGGVKDGLSFCGVVAMRSPLILYLSTTSLEEFSSAVAFSATISTMSGAAS